MSRSERRSIRALIVEDEEQARRTLRRLLTEAPDVTVVGEAAGRAALDAIRDLRPDLVFLDVEMPGMDGLEILSELEPAEIPVVVFVTAYEEYAVRAFEVAAVDYLLKPFSDARLQTSLQRVRRILRDDQISEVRDRLERVLELVDDGGTGSRAEAPTIDSPLVFRDSSRTHLVHPEDIDWIEARGVYVRIHAGDRELLVRESLTRIERRLESLGFYRVHRSALVRLDRIVELSHLSHGDYRLLLEDGTELKLARTRTEGLEERLGRSLR